MTKLNRTILAASFIGTAASVAFTGCGGTAASGEPSNVRVIVSQAQIKVLVDFDDCASAPADTKVMFNDLEVPMESKGGRSKLLLEDGYSCDSATFILDTPTSFARVNPDSLLTIAGGGISVRAAFKDLIGPRTLSLLAGNEVTAGSRATFQVTPTGDTACCTEKLRWDTPAGIQSTTGATISGNQITADVPSDAKSGEMITLSWGRGAGLTEAKVVECSGAVACYGQPMVEMSGATVRVH